jgi:arylformamidase
VYINGMYDLTPVRLSARSRYAAFNDATVSRRTEPDPSSRPAAGAPLVVAYGTHETHYNHFELPETLGNPYGLLGRAALLPNTKISTLLLRCSPADSDAIVCGLSD